MKLVTRAINESGFDYRTAEDIAGDTGVELRLVVHALTNRFLARESVFTSRDGKRMYAPSKHTPTLAERAEALRWVAAN